MLYSSQKKKLALLFSIFFFINTKLHWKWNRNLQYFFYCGWSMLMHQCVKSVQRRVFLARIFPYSVQIRKIRTRKTPYLDIFHAVHAIISWWRSLPQFQSLNYTDEVLNKKKQTKKTKKQTNKQTNKKTDQYFSQCWITAQIKQRNMYIEI